MKKIMCMVVGMACLGLMMGSLVASGGCAGEKQLAANPVVQQLHANVQADMLTVVNTAHPVVQAVITAETQQAAANYIQVPANAPSSTATNTPDGTGIMQPSASGAFGSSTGMAAITHQTNANANMEKSKSAGTNGGTSSDASASGG